jgi:hypothetical protein
MKFFKMFLSAMQWSDRAQRAAMSYKGDRTKMRAHVLASAGQV